MKKLVILSDDLKNYNGHYYEYIKSLKETFEPRGVTVRIYSDRDIDPVIQEELNAVPFFYNAIFGDWLSKIPFAGKLYNRVRSRIHHIKRLRMVYNMEKGEDTYFMFEFPVMTTLLPIILSLRKSKPKAIFIFRLSFNKNIEAPKNMKTLGRMIYHYAFRFFIRNNYVLTSDSEVIADEFTERYKYPMPVLPIPHLVHSGDVAARRTQDVAHKFICYVPGMFARHKGVDFILNTFEQLSASNSELNNRLVLVTQFNDQLYSKENNMAIRERMSRMKIETVFLSSLTTEGYNDQFSASDIILVTYDLDSGFAYRTSGVMSDAMAFEKPFITSQGTWMEKQARKYNTGIAIPYNDSKAFEEALLTLTGNYEAYQEKARHAKPEWLNFHSKENYYRILTQAIADNRSNAGAR